MSFNTLGLSTELLRAIQEQGYTQPTPIQSQAIPAILEGGDILAGAQTGTGKTAGFTLPLLQRIAKIKQNSKSNHIRALVLTPTRELAAQVSDSVTRYGKYLPIRSTVIFGGVKFGPQANKLRKGVDVLVATPGRLLDHVRQQTVDLSGVEILVLDEADRMLDMGFIHDIRQIMQTMPKKRQSLLFSATFSSAIKQLANSLLHKPVHIEVARDKVTTESIKQIVHPVDRQRKRELLSYLIGSNNWEQVLVFARTKRGTDRLALQLKQDGIRTASIHGDKSQGARTKALVDFKHGKIRVLVATDIAARGIDITQLPHVINYELPDVAEDYVHRIGRTGRAGNIGEARSLVCVDEHKQLREIERLTQNNLTHTVIPGFEVDKSIKAEPIQRGRSKKEASNKPSNFKAKRKGEARKPGGKRPPLHAMSNKSRSRNNSGQSRHSA